MSKRLSINTYHISLYLIMNYKTTIYVKQNKLKNKEPHPMIWWSWLTHLLAWSQQPKTHLLDNKSEELWEAY